MYMESIETVFASLLAEVKLTNCLWRISLTLLRDMFIIINDQPTYDAS